MVHITCKVRCLAGITHTCIQSSLRKTLFLYVATRQFYSANAVSRQLNFASVKQLKSVHTSSKQSGLVAPASARQIGPAETISKQLNPSQPIFRQANPINSVRQQDRINGLFGNASNSTLSKTPGSTFVSKFCRSLFPGSQGILPGNNRLGPLRPSGYFSSCLAGVWKIGDSSLGSMAPAVTGWVSTAFQSQRNYATGIQKHMSALTVKRPVRKKTPKVQEEEMEKYADVVVAYAVAEEFDLSQLRQALQTQGLYHICELPMDVQDAVHVRAKYAVDEKNREVFFFRDGSAVFWSMPEVERKEVLRFLQKHDEGRYSQDLILKGREELDLKYIKGPTSLSGDTLQLNEDSESGHAVLEKYAFSNALAQSVKLSIWEAILEKFVDSIESVTEDLRDGKKISMSRREVLRKTGELFALRHLINLSSDLLDTPDFYWDRAVLEPLFMAVHNHLDVTRRTRVMNEKLSHCCELMELLSSHLNDAHHTRLEVMIIVLIMVEVVFEFIHYAERYFSLQHEETVNAREVSAHTTPPPSST